jgi:hypothetical protein
MTVDHAKVAVIRRSTLSWRRAPVPQFAQDRVERPITATLAWYKQLYTVKLRTAHCIS